MIAKKEKNEKQALSLDELEKVTGGVGPFKAPQTFKCACGALFETQAELDDHKKTCDYEHQEKNLF